MDYKFNILILNGPNLNLLGIREPSKYGKITLQKVIINLKKQANQLQTKITHFQSNAEYELINQIHQSKNNVDYIIINPAGLTHTSIVLRDALLAVNIPFIEVHISNIYARESFRHNSYISSISDGIICGLGTDGYSWALQAAIKRLS